MKDEMSWNQAAEACRKTYGQYGGTLAKLTDPDMANIIFSRTTKGKFWTGLYCTTDSCLTMQWSDCSPYVKDTYMLSKDDNGRCFYVSSDKTDTLFRDECHERLNYICQYTNPNSDNCGDGCNTSSGIPMCPQSGRSVALKPSRDSGCYAQCAQTLGCWMFWDVDQNTCLLGVSACYTVNTSTVTVSVKEDNSDTPRACSTTSVPKESNYRVTSSSNVQVSPGQSCDTTVTIKETVTVGTTATARASEPPMITTTTTVTMTTTSIQPTTVTVLTTVHLQETVNVQALSCPDGSALDSWLSSCSQAATPRLMTSFQIYSSTLYITTSSLGNHIPTVTLTDAPSGFLSHGTYHNSQETISGVIQNEMVQLLTSSIVQELKVPTENLSKTKRLKISVYDGRSSSTVSGVSACIFLGMTALFILAIDLSKLYGPVLRTLKTFKS
ncbi:hypothetical protein Btru_041863 [Bulinus truncatus]|nr:hypothetical protein Btru_041863 [Bulinus truncatus]